jgi:drug/metabolite transporter (DMT)-like permease
MPNRTIGFRFKTGFFLLLIVIFAPLGNVLLGKGMKTIGSATNWDLGSVFPILLRVLTSPYIAMGILSLLIFFIAHMLVLTWADYSYVQPASSFSYVSVALLSYLLLGEKISALRCLGIAVICVGVMIVGRTHPKTTGAH